MRGSPPSSAVGYPLFDLFFLVLLVVCVTSAPSRGRALPLIGAGFLLVAGADIVYAWQSTAGNYLTGALFDPLWPAGVLLVAAAAWQPAVPAEEASPRLQQLAPAAFVVIALGMLAVHDLWDLPVESLVLAIGALLSATLRSLGTSAGYLHMLQVSESRRAELDAERARAQLSEKRLAEAEQDRQIWTMGAGLPDQLTDWLRPAHVVLDFDKCGKTQSRWISCWSGSTRTISAWWPRRSARPSRQQAPLYIRDPHAEPQRP